MHYKAVSAEQTAKSVPFNPRPFNSLSLMIKHLNRVKGLTQEEKLLYQLIEAEGNMGTSIYLTPSLPL